MMKLNKISRAIDTNYDKIPNPFQKNWLITHDTALLM